MNVTNIKNFPFALKKITFHLSNLLVLFQGKKNFEALKMFFNFMVNFWTTVDENGSISWTETQDKLSILYHSNDGNIDFENIFSILNNIARTYGLDTQGWKLPFTMSASNCEHWDYDYFKRIEFICRKCFFFFFF